MFSRLFCRRVVVLAAAGSALVGRTTGLNIPANDSDALSLAVKQVADGVLSFYGGDGNGVGLFPDPYLYWEAGAAWDALINYWYLTGDDSHNAAAQAALATQANSDGDYMQPNQSLSLTNDDQATWGLAAMTAAERDFPLAQGGRDTYSSWAHLASNVFDEQAARWESETTTACGGGLRWSIYTFQNGYSYKAATAQAHFFQLASRLARFTGNQTYVDWAARIYDWTRDIGLILESGAVLDGTMVRNNCSAVNGQQWSYVTTSFAYGSAVLANITSDAVWTTRTTTHVSQLLDEFFPAGGVLAEATCTEDSECTTEARIMAAPTLRWLSLIPVFQPAVLDAVAPALDSTAAAATSRCAVQDGDDFALCRGFWDDDDQDGQTNTKFGLGAQLPALEVLLSRFTIGGGGALNSSIVLRTVNGTAASSSSSSSSVTSTGGSAATSSTGKSAAAIGRSNVLSSSWGLSVMMTTVSGMAWLL